MAQPAFDEEDRDPVFNRNLRVQAPESAAGGPFWRQTMSCAGIVAICFKSQFSHQLFHERRVFLRRPR
jgi:hypothetical protein